MKDQQKNELDFSGEGHPAEPFVPAYRRGNVAAGTSPAAAKKAFDADRLARRQDVQAAPRVVSAELIAKNLGAFTAHWRLTTVEGQNFLTGDAQLDSFNVESLQRIIQHHLRVGWPLDVELLPRSYAWGVEQNYLDRRRRDAAGLIVSVRGGMHLTPPTMCPKCIWPDEVQQLAVEDATKAIADRLAEDVANKKKSFAQLQAEVRKHYKPPKPGGPTP
jgi:hypothetical protein